MSKKPPYNFGISQEDALTEAKGLKLVDGDRLLCIASAGEVPLNLLATNNIIIVACDTSIEQLFLSKLKLAAVLHFNSRDSAQLLGYIKVKKNKRLKLFEELVGYLSEDERYFWQNNIDAIAKGPINSARFEKYITKFSWIARLILGNRKLRKLMSLTSVEDQQVYFDQHLSSRLLRLVFKTAFHPKIYKNRGMDEHGLQHQEGGSISKFFYNRFRDFCTSTLASKNYYLQYTLFNEVLTQKALPEFLSEDGIKRIRLNSKNITFQHIDFTGAIQSKEKAFFNKFHLSNIGDWLTQEGMTKVFSTIKSHASNNSELIYRYIHKNHPIIDELKQYYLVNHKIGKELIMKDRYPFYNIVVISFKRS